MDRIAEELEKLDDEWMNDFHTPQSLAWKLLTSDDINDLSSAIMSFNLDKYDEAHDPVSFTFEIMLTIFAEMLCSLMLIFSEDDENVRKSLRPNDFFETIKEKLLKASVTMHLTIIEKEWLQNDTQYFQKILDRRYCRIILRDSDLENHLFDKYDVDDEVMYHMLLNPKYKKQSKLKDIFVTLETSNCVYSISFDFFKLLEPDVPKFS